MATIVLELDSEWPAGDVEAVPPLGLSEPAGAGASSGGGARSPGGASSTGAESSAGGVALTSGTVPIGGMPAGAVRDDAADALGPPSGKAAGGAGLGDAAWPPFGLLEGGFGGIVLISIEGIRSGFGPRSGSVPRGAEVLLLGAIADDGLTAGSPVAEIAGNPTAAFVRAPELGGGRSGKPLGALAAGIVPMAGFASVRPATGFREYVVPLLAPPAAGFAAPTGVKAAEPCTSFPREDGCGIAVSGEVGNDETGGS